MLKLTLFSLLLALTGAYAQGNGTRVLKEYKVIPDVLDDFTVKTLLSIQYRETTMYDAIILTTQLTASQPNITWPAASASQLYTLAMVDPDAQGREILHWLVLNVPGNQLSRGAVKTAYRGPRPPAGGGLHRYVQVLYANPNGPIDPTPPVPNPWHLRDWAKAVKLGDPVAATFFRAQNL